MKKVLITGVAGFIGSHLAKYLSEKGYEVRGVDNLSHPVKDWDKIVGPISVGDLCDIYKLSWVGKDILLSVYGAKFDVAVHLAAEISVDFSMQSPWKSLYNNVVSTLNMLELCRVNDAKMIYASSCEVLGSSQYGDKPMDEKHPYNPVSPYGYSKLIGELLCKSYYKTYGLKVNIMRPFNIFGSRQREDDYGGVIAKFTRRALNNQPPEIYGDGLQTRDYTYVDDIVRAYEMAINADFKGEPVNFGSGREVSVNELADLILKLTGKTHLKPVHVTPRRNEVKRSWCDPTKAKELLGWKAEIPFKEGLKRYIGWRGKLGEN